MPGMGTNLQTTNPTIVAAFQSMLLREGLVLLALLALLAIAWNLLRASALRRATGPHLVGAVDPVVGEPRARRLLRIAFGCLWLFDGVLQGQTSMPLGLANGVIASAAATSPPWVRHLVGVGVTIWNNHPVTAAASAVWIQVGIGLFLLVAPAGRWSRAAGLASMTWGLLVWVFGEAFGGIFAGGLTVLFGAPGAALVYAVAGALLMLRDEAWTSGRLGRWLLAAIGAFYLGMALLQAWPGRGFWQGHIRGGGPGTLTAMVSQMASTSQPSWLSRLVGDFADFEAAHGFAVNLFAVAALAAIGLALSSGKARLVRVAVVANVVLCLADWVLVEDLGFLGGVGTDPNNMIPLVLLATAAAMASRAVVSPAGATTAAVPPAASSEGRLAGLLARPSFLLRSLAACGALVIVALGAVPMALASVNPVADPILTEAIDGTPSATDLPLLSFSLEDQHGREVTAGSLRGKAVVLTFLDPVCTTDCPVIAQELKAADAMLGPLAGRAEFVAVVANPLYNTLAATRTFDSVEGLSKLPNWLYLTGSVRALSRLWNNYDAEVTVASGGEMVQHADIAYLVDPRGKIREILNSDPGQGSAPLESSFAGLVASDLRQLLS